MCVLSNVYTLPCMYIFDMLPGEEVRGISPLSSSRGAVIAEPLGAVGGGG
jgi:hypothetical protein